MHIVVHEKEEREKEVEIFKELMADNFLNPERDLDIQVYETQQSPKRFNLKISFPKTIMLKISKIEERILKAIIEKKNPHIPENPIRLSTYFSEEILQARESRIAYSKAERKGKKTSVSEVYFTWLAILQKYKR